MKVKSLFAAWADDFGDLSIEGATLILRQDGENGRVAAVEMEVQEAAQWLSFLSGDDADLDVHYQDGDSLFPQKEKPHRSEA